MGIDPVTHSFRLDLLDFSTILNSSLYNNSKLSRLLGMQPLINNPDMMRLGSSLLSPQRQNHDFLIQNNSNTLHQNQQINDNSQAHNQIPPSLIQMQTPFQDFTIPSNHFDAKLSDHDQAHQLMHYDDLENFPQNLSGFGSENCKVNDWDQSNGSLLSSLTEDYSLPVTNYGYYGLDQPVVGPTPSSETCAFESNSSNNFSFQSVLTNISTPLSNST